MDTKYCSNRNCPNQNPQPVSNFSINRRVKSGLCSQCKTCTSIRAKAYYRGILAEPRPKPPSGMKVCSYRGCFYKGEPQSIKNFNSNISKKDKLDHYCRECRHKADKKSWTREKNWKKMGISFTMRDFDRLFEAQGHRCAICGKHQSELPMILNVDHDHSTLEVRGLLCSSCNSLIGFAKEDISILEKAISYLGSS